MRYDSNSARSQMEGYGGFIRSEAESAVKAPRGKLAERGVDDPSGPGVAHTRIRLNTTVSRVEEAA